MNFSWSSVLQEKHRQREEAAERSIAEKLRVLEQLRERDAEIKRAAQLDSAKIRC